MADLLKRAKELLEKAHARNWDNGKCKSCKEDAYNGGHRAWCEYSIWESEMFRWMTDLTAQKGEMRVTLRQEYTTKHDWHGLYGDIHIARDDDFFSSKADAIADARRVAESLGLECVVEGEKNDQG